MEQRKPIQSNKSQKWEQEKKKKQDKSIVNRKNKMREESLTSVFTININGLIFKRHTGFKTKSSYNLTTSWLNNDTESLKILGEKDLLIK